MQVYTPQKRGNAVCWFFPRQRGEREVLIMHGPMPTLSFFLFPPHCAVAMGGVKTRRRRRRKEA